MNVKLTSEAFISRSPARQLYNAPVKKEPIEFMVNPKGSK
jgi:hypothetical protein